MPESFSGSGLKATRRLCAGCYFPCAARTRPARMRGRCVHIISFEMCKGVWACSDPQCREVDEIYRKAGTRRVGKLFLQPRIPLRVRCARSRVLYCQTCGELFLGGYRAPDPDRPSATSWFLVSDIPDLEQLPDAAFAERTASRYALYWPQSAMTPKRTKPWTRENQAFRFSFKRAHFDHRVGPLTATELDPTGWLFHIESPPDRDPPALPIYCPQCDDKWSWVPSSGSLTTRADEVPHSIHAYRLREGDTGARGRAAPCLPTSRAAQAGCLHRQPQDAAKLSAGFERRHYEDTVRQLLVATARRGSGDELNCRDSNHS